MYTFHQSENYKDQHNCSRHKVCAKEIDHRSPCITMTRAAALSAAFSRGSIIVAIRPPWFLWRGHICSSELQTLAGLPAKSRSTVLREPDDFRIVKDLGLFVAFPRRCIVSAHRPSGFLWRSHLCSCDLEDPGKDTSCKIVSYEVQTLVSDRPTVVERHSCKVQG